MPSAEDWENENWDPTIYGGSEYKHYNRLAFIIAPATFVAGIFGLALAVTAQCCIQFVRHVRMRPAK